MYAHRTSNFRPMFADRHHYNKYPTNETRNGAGQPHHPQAHPVVTQPPSSTSRAVALFAILTARHFLRNFAVEARSFSVRFALSVRRLSILPSVSRATLTGDATYDLSKRGFPVRRRYVWSIKHHRWASVPKKRRVGMKITLTVHPSAHTSDWGSILPPVRASGGWMFLGVSRVVAVVWRANY